MIETVFENGDRTMIYNMIKHYRAIKSEAVLCKLLHSFKFATEADIKGFYENDIKDQMKENKTYKSQISAAAGTLLFGEYTCEDLKVHTTEYDKEMDLIGEINANTSSRVFVMLKLKRRMFFWRIESLKLDFAV